MTARGGRIVCPRCGANNFDTVTACWKCAAPLSAGGHPSPAAMAVPPVPAGYERQTVPGSGYASYLTGDPAVAKRAALWLAVTMPWFGLPIGWAFMMIEDTRKQAIGKFCATWSIVALCVHLFLMFLSMQAMGAVLVKVLPQLMSNGAVPRGLGGAGTTGSGLESGSGAQ